VTGIAPVILHLQDKILSVRIDNEILHRWISPLSISRASGRCRPAQNQARCNSNGVLTWCHESRGASPRL